MHETLEIFVMDFGKELHERSLLIHHEDVGSAVEDMGMLRVI